jgi:ABC-2 type transport system ATP-binding protein
MALALELTNISKRYTHQAKPALDNVSLAIDSGTITGILGPNGAGKTTLVKLIIGIIFPTSGTGTVCGKPLGNLSAKEQIGYVPEHLRLPTMLTAEQVLTLFGNLSGLSGKLLQARIDEVLEQVAMSYARRTKISNFSKGMMHRIGIAQALLTQPTLLILDEPTDGIDPQGRIEIKNIITDLNNRGTTILINSHVLTEVEQITDSFFILDRGRVVRHGVIDSIVANQQCYFIACSQAQIEHVQSVLQSQFSIKITQDTLPLKHTESNQPQVLLECDFENALQLNQCLDILRSHNIMIESIERKQTRLEDIFMQSIVQHAV